MRGILLLCTANDLVEDTINIEVGVLQVCKKQLVLLGVDNKQGLVLQRASWGTEIRGDVVRTEAALCVAGAPP